MYAKKKTNSANYSNKFLNCQKRLTIQSQLLTDRAPKSRSTIKKLRKFGPTNDQRSPRCC